MIRSPFVGQMEKAKDLKQQMEKAKDLMEIIHGAVCGPFSEMARGRFYYFIAFIDDLSRYGHFFF